MTTNGNQKAGFILEVGFSETYDELVQDARLWLEGTGEVSVVVLVKFTETPKYECRTRGLDYEDFENLGFPEASQIKASDFSLEGRRGPVNYKDLGWVGQISEFQLSICSS